MRAKKAVGAAVAVAVAGISAGFVVNNASAEQVTTAAPASAHHTHGLGLNVAAAKANHGLTAKHNTAQPVLKRNGAAPPSFDLSQFANQPGDQGQVGSCVTWATGYTGYGVLMNEQKITGGPMAPMFIYAQIAKGNDQGTTAEVALPMEQQQGIDTKSDYTQGDFDFTTQPTDAEKQNAAKFKLSGETNLPTKGTDAKNAIEDAISQGLPVPFGFQVHQSFMNMDATTAGNYSYTPGDAQSDPIQGGHEVTIVAYNEQGVKVENSWGNSWGAQGYFTLPWKFFDGDDVSEVHSMGKLVQQ